MRSHCDCIQYCFRMLIRHTHGIKVCPRGDDEHLSGFSPGVDQKDGNYVLNYSAITLIQAGEGTRVTSPVGSSPPVDESI